MLEWHQQRGGPVATALAALSRLGISCRFYGIIGEDDAGEKIRQSLIEEGIDIMGKEAVEARSEVLPLLFSVN